MKKILFFIPFLFQHIIKAEYKIDKLCKVSEGAFTAACSTSNQHFKATIFKNIFVHSINDDFVGYSFNTNHEGIITVLCSLNKNLIASGSADSTIKIWYIGDINSENGLPSVVDCLVTLHGHYKEITCICLLPDGRLASGSSDGDIKIWNLITKKCEFTINAAHGGHKIKGMCVLKNKLISMGTKTLKSWSLSSTSSWWDRMWDKNSDEIIALCENNEIVYNLKFLNDNKKALGWYGKKTIIFDNITEMEPRVLSRSIYNPTLQTYTSTSYTDGMFISTNSNLCFTGLTTLKNQFVVAAYNNKIIFWDVFKKEIDLVDTPHTKDIIFLCSNDHELFTSSWAGTYHWEFNDGYQISQTKLIEQIHKTPIISLSIINNKAFFSGEADGSYAIWKNK